MTPPQPVRLRISDIPVHDGSQVHIAGRLLACEDEVATFHLSDGHGTVVISDISGNAAAPRAGDFIVATGYVRRQTDGKIIVACSRIDIKVRPDRPPPASQEWYRQPSAYRYRHREIDFLLSPDLRVNLTVRSKVIRAFRQVLDGLGYLEVETPILLAARDVAPVPHFLVKRVEQPFYLRTCPESYLKRLIVGGFDRVYEIGKSFRDERASSRRLPEFTLMECYEAFAGYQQMADLTEDLIATAAEQALGHAAITVNGHDVDLREPWRRVFLREAVMASTGRDILTATDDDLRALLSDRARPVTGVEPRWNLIDGIVDAYIGPDLQDPTFLMDYPVETICVAARHPGDPRVIERFEAYIGGMEIAHAFSELTDPQDQRVRMNKVLSAKINAGYESHPLDEDFLQALEHGLPPTGGLGIGIDRVLMLLLNRPIHDIVSFPLVE